MLKQSFGVLCQPTSMRSRSLARLYATPTPLSTSSLYRPMVRSIIEQLSENANGVRYLSRMSERELERVRHVHNKSTREWRNLRAGPRMALVVFGLFITGGA